MRMGIRHYTIHRRYDGKLIVYVPYWTHRLFPGSHFMIRIGPWFLARAVEYRFAAVVFNRRFNANGYAVKR